MTDFQTGLVIGAVISPFFIVCLIAIWVLLRGNAPYHTETVVKPAKRLLKELKNADGKK